MTDLPIPFPYSAPANLKINKIKKVGPSDNIIDVDTNVKISIIWFIGKDKNNGGFIIFR